MFDIVIVDDVVDVDLAVIAECKFCTIFFCIPGRGNLPRLEVAFEANILHLERYHQGSLEDT
jgi:hypothetical protein